MKIVLISSGQPSANPRLVKEADALIESGYHVTVIYQYWDKWCELADQKLLKFKKWKAIKVAGDPNDEKTLYWISRILHKFTRNLSTIFTHNFLYILGTSRASYFLYREGKKHKADLYIGHNLGALPIAVKLAKFHSAKAGFDAEDFHRNEVSDDKNTYQYKAAKKLEDQYIPQLDHFTAASPLIAEAYHHLYPHKKAIVINNVFSNQFIQKESISYSGNDLKLFWFSQTIGKDRGLEQVIAAMGKLANPQITLTLLGMISATEQAYFEALVLSHGLTKNQLIFLAPVAPHQIFEIASRHHIGLALELNKPYNRDICLTNKIFTYLTAGLAIVASETQAQQKLMNEHPGIGQTFPIGDVDRLANILAAYYSNPSLLNEQPKQAKELAKNKLNWEMESEKLINAIDKTIRTE